MASSAGKNVSGIGGLAAAHHLTVRAAERGIPLEVVVLEASGRPGGWLATEHCEGSLLERGPDTLVTHKPAGLALCKRLGLDGRLVYRPAGMIDILDDGRLVPLPAGFTLAVGSDRSAGSGEPANESAADESVASYVRRRFGDELYRRFYEPVVGGLFMADAEELSLAASFPRRASQGSEPPRPAGPPARLRRLRPLRSTAGSARSSPPWSNVCRRERCGWARERRGSPGKARASL